LNDELIAERKKVKNLQETSREKELNLEEKIS